MERNNSLFFSIIVVVSAVVIGFGIFVYRSNILKELSPEKKETQHNQNNQINKITENNHILGNPNADLILIEYADFLCIYCKEFHNTMRIIMDQYGSSGRIAWVYRHSPSQTDVNSDSMRLALTSECVAKFFGNSNFWLFVNKIFDDNLPTGQIDKLSIDLALEKLNIDKEKINNCVQNQETLEVIEQDIMDQRYLLSADNNFGTPYNVIIPKTGEVMSFSGAIPYVFMEDLIKQYSVEF